MFCFENNIWDQKLVRFGEMSILSGMEFDGDQVRFNGYFTLLQNYRVFFKDF